LKEEVGIGHARKLSDLSPRKPLPYSSVLSAKGIANPEQAKDSGERTIIPTCVPQFPDVDSTGCPKTQDEGPEE